MISTHNRRAGYMIDGYKNEGNRWLERLPGMVALAMLLLILASGCKKTDPNAAIYAAQGYMPTYERADCQFAVPAGYEVECGYLSVPEDRSQPQVATIRLHVAVFKSTSPDPAPDPVIHLYGGPGGSLLDNADFYMKAGGAEILKSRDYVLFNQRGARYADPFLDCPGATELHWQLSAQGLSHAQREARQAEFILTCQEELLNRWINLAAYNSAENAADVNDLRLALGYDQVNLYGVSYGGRLALTVMRDHPEAVRSAIIDSSYPPQSDLNNEFALSAARAFRLIFDSCAADPHCQSVYPDLETTFYRVIDTLNANPVQVTLSKGAVYIDGDDIIDLTYGSLYTFYGPGGVTWIPQMITTIDQGHLNDLIPALEVMFREDGFSEGMYYSVLCREEVPVDSYETALALAADLPHQIRDHYVSPAMVTICASWESGLADPIESQPVVSDIPALVLAGQYDPITPPGYSQIIAETLSKGFFYEIPGIGHGAMRGSDCGLEIGLRFLDDPEHQPETACLGN